MTSMYALYPTIWCYNCCFQQPYAYFLNYEQKGKSSILCLPAYVLLRCHSSFPKDLSFRLIPFPISLKILPQPFLQCRSVDIFLGFHFSLNIFISLSVLRIIFAHSGVLGWQGFVSFPFSILKILFCLWDSVTSYKKSAIISIVGPSLYNRSFFSGYFQDFFLYNWLIVISL